MSLVWNSVFYKYRCLSLNKMGNVCVCVCVCVYIYIYIYIYMTNIQACSCSHCCSGKAISTTYSEFMFVALVIQHVKRMRHIVSVALQYFSALSHKRQDFQKKLLNTK